MSARPGTAKEALLAEVLGDIQLLLERVELADNSARETAQALNEATAAYRTQVDDIATRLRSETASIINLTTEHAARSLVGQQALTLEQAAKVAMQKVLTEQLLKRTRRDWLAAAAIGGLTGALVCSLMLISSTLL
jgi:hypothetical protein